MLLFRWRRTGSSISMETMFPLRESIYRALRWSERYTKTDMVYLFSGGVWLTVAQVGMGIVAFVLSVAFARFVSKDVYGTYRFLLSLYWTLTAFSFTGLAPAVVRAVAKGEEGAYKQSFLYTFLGSLPMACIALGFSVYYFIHGNSLLGFGALIICVVGPLYQLGYLYGSFLEGKKDFKRTAYFGIIVNLVPALVMLGAMLYPANALIFFLIYLGAGALTGLILCWLAFRIYRPNNIKGEKLLNLGGHFSLMNILSTGASQLDQLLVFHFFGGVSLAVYSFATAIPDQGKNIFGTIENLALPKFVQRPMVEIKKTFNVRLFNFSLLGLLSAVVYILAAPLIFRILFPAYMDAVFYSQLYAIALIPVSNVLPLTILQAHAAKKELYLYNILSPVFQIITLVAGILLWGIIGILLARIISRFFNLLLLVVLLQIYAAKND